eukprot:1159425-Pelagomonas_calceolata.AAC.5
MPNPCCSCLCCCADADAWSPFATFAAGLEGTGGALFRNGVTQERELQKKGTCTHEGMCIHNIAQSRLCAHKHTSKA